MRSEFEGRIPSERELDDGNRLDQPECVLIDVVHQMDRLELEALEIGHRLRGRDLGDEREVRVTDMHVPETLGDMSGGELASSISDDRSD
jgi:hypothetical protein